MKVQNAQPNVEQTEQEAPVENRQSWEQPKLERLHVSLDTAASKGSFADGSRMSNIPSN